MAEKENASEGGASKAGEQSGDSLTENKSSASETPDNYARFSPEIQSQLVHVAKHHNCSWQAEDPWTRAEILRDLASNIASIYTTTSLVATSSEDLIRILYAHAKRDAVPGSDVAGIAAADREIAEVRATIPTLALTITAFGNEQTISAPEAAKRSRVLPSIQITTDQKAVVNAAEQALSKRGGIYVRGRKLVHVIYDQGSSEWLRRPDGMPVVAELAVETLREILGSCAQWVKLDPRGVLRKVMVPRWVVETLVSRGAWELPAIEGITDTPVMRPDGTILDKWDRATQGYDPTTRLIYKPAVVYPKIPNAPTRDDARAALAVLLDPFCDVCFADEFDRSAAVALILSMIARAAIDGPVPMFGVVAPTPGSGKGLVAELASIIATGRKPPLMAPTDNDDETRKRLLALAIEAPTMIVIDNVEGQLGSPSLAMALTTGEVKDRLLGKTQTVTASLRAVWVYTGNNVGLKGDLGRRVVPIALDPKVEHPEDRGGWIYPDVRKHVESIRPKLVVAALTLLRAYVVANRPAHGKSRKGSFEAWDDLVRGAIIWAGGADPVGGVQRIRDAGDSDLDNLRTLLTTWHGAYGDAAKTTRELIGDSRMREALDAYKPERDLLDSTKLGYVLRRHKDRPASGLKLCQAGRDANNVTTWKVVRI